MHLVLRRRGGGLAGLSFRHPTRRRLYRRSQARRIRPVCLQPPIAPSGRGHSALGPLAATLLLTALLWGALGWLAPLLGIR